MLALARAAAAELGRGLSTALIVRAGSQSCARCPDCNLVCPEPARIPDCVCQAGARQPDPSCPALPGLSNWICIFLCGVLVGIAVHWKLSRESVVEGKPVAFPGLPIATQENIDRETIATEARLQIAAVKARARHGSATR